MSTHKGGSKSGSSSSSGISLIHGFTKTLELSSFGVLYAMIKGNTFPRILTLLSILVEFCQFSSFGFKHQYPWGGEAGYYLKKIMSPVNHPSNVLGYDGFIILYWIAVGLLLLGFINIWYVAFQFYRGKIANIWVIRTLRWFVSFSVAVLFIPIISLLLIGLDCEYTDKGAFLRKFDSETIYCYRGKNLPIAIISIILIILFSQIGLTSSATYYEYDTSVKSRFAKPHARFDVIILFSKLVFAFLNSLVDFVPWLTSIVFFVVMLFLTAGSILVLPYNNQRLNQVKSGFYMSVLFISFMTVITMAIDDTTSAATCYITIVGVFPAFPIGYFLNRAYYNWLCRKISGIQLPTFGGGSTMDLHEKGGSNNNLGNVSPAGSKVTWGKQPITLGSKRQILFPFFANKFVLSFFVEIMARSLLNGNNEGVSTSSAESIERANNLYQCGLQYFPNSDILWMAYCNFLFTVRKDRHIGYAALEKLRRMKPSFDVRFFIYQRDKEREQIMDSDLRGPEHNGKIQDFVSYMEFKKLYYGAKRHHVKCLTYIKKFWSLLLHETVDLHRLSDLSGRIATAENKANETYERLLALNPNSVRVLRDYSQFLEEVVKDKDSSFRLQKKAEAIEEIMSKSQTTDFKISDIKNLDGSDDEQDKEVEQILKSEPNAIQLAKIDADIEKSNNSKSGGGSQKSKDDSSESSSSSKGRKSKYREFQQSNAINKLAWLMIATTACCIIFLIVVLVVFRGLAVKHSNAYQGILSITDCATEAVTIAIAFNTMQAYAFASGTPFFPEFAAIPLIEKLQAENERSLIVMKNIHDSIYWGEGAPVSYVGDNLSTLKSRNGFDVFDIGTEVFTFDQFNRSNSVLKNKKMTDLYNEPSVNMTILIAPKGSNQTDYKLYSQGYNAWKAGNAFIESAIISNKMNITELKAAAFNVDFKFVILNAPSTIPSVFIKIQQAYIDSLVDDINSTTSSIMYTWLGIFGFLVLLGAVLFRPIVTKITREKIKTLVLFSLAPRDVVIKLSTKKIKMVSLDSGSDRDNLFDTTDDDHEDHHLNDGEVGNRKKNDDHLVSINVTDIKGSTTIIVGSSGSGGGGSPINQTIGKLQLSDCEVEPRENRSNSGNNHFGDRRPLMDSIGVLNSTTSNRNRIGSSDGGSKLTAIDQPIDLTSKGTTTQQQLDPKYSWDGVSKRNLNKKSLRSVLNRLHWSYIGALFLLFGFITMGIWVSFSVVSDNSESGYTLAQSCTRALDARIINYQIAELYTFDGDSSKDASLNAVTELQLNHQSLPYLEDVRPLMEGGVKCWALDQSQCFNSSSIYYYDVSQGMDWLIDQYAKKVINLANTESSQLIASPDLAWMQTVGSDYLFDGLDGATFIYFQYFLDAQTSATKILTAILAVSCVLLLVIYLVLFRPFMNHLRIQHIHTLALLRLAPDDIRHMEVSDKVIDED